MKGKNVAQVRIARILQFFLHARIILVKEKWEEK